MADSDNNNPSVEQQEEVNMTFNKDSCVSTNPAMARLWSQSNTGLLYLAPAP